MNNIKIKLLNNDAKIPAKATEHSSGYDLFSSEEKILKSRKFELISTGISVELEPGFEAQIRPRSGLAAKNGITVLNSPGTIDADYRGEVKVILINHSDVDFLITKGMRIAQMIFSNVINAQLVLTNELNSTKRSSGGFGSTGLI
ncbi:MAG: dUTP diphosphatase [Spirochaetes bacterium]|nr:dUTP diphosphatase [Spirochaetota bacterium]